LKYKYLYQTKDNENREGWVTARDRADAYAKLRKEGIRPYRLIGDDPAKWRRWLVPSAAAAALVVSTAAAVLAFAGRRAAPVGRCQLTGDSSVISACMADGWAGVFESNLDRYLAAYAQPGWIALPPETTDAEVDAFAAELERPLSAPGATGPETKMMESIVASMRQEMRDYLAGGGSVREYLEFLEERQDQEREFRRKAMDAVARAPEFMRERTMQNVNVRLREMGLPELSH